MIIKNFMKFILLLHTVSVKFEYDYGYNDYTSTGANTDTGMEIYDM